MHISLFTFLIMINILGYILMCTDKIKAIYHAWRISEKALWMIAMCGGVWGIWLGMKAPLYHKAGKRNFQIGVPCIALIWGIMIIYFSIQYPNFGV